MFKSLKDAFAAAERKLNTLGYAVDGTTSDYRPTQKQPGFRRSMTQMPITGTDSVVLVIREKVSGMATSYDVMVVNGPKAIDMKLHAMSQPADESYKTLIGEV